MKKKIPLRVSYVRIYSLPALPAPLANLSNPSPLVVPDQPHGASETRLHWGPIPPHVALAIKHTRTWLSRVLQGGYPDAKALKAAAATASLEDIVGVGKAHVTIEIRDTVSLEKDDTQPLLGVTAKSFVALESTNFFHRRQVDLDRFVVRTAEAISPHRFDRLVWNDPWIEFPTGVFLRPFRTILHAPRLFVSSSSAVADIASVINASPSRPSKSLALARHFYLRAYASSDNASRLFDSFRAIEALTRALSRQIPASQSFANRSGSAGRAAHVARGLRNKFARLALAWYPSDADGHYDSFEKLYAWRNDLAHGLRIIEPHEAPGEEAFALAQLYIFRSA